MPPDAQYPVALPGPAYGDIQSGAHLAGGIAAALFQRERTGQGAVVDVSLLGSGLWAMQPAIAGAHAVGPGAARPARPAPAGQPAVERVPDGRRPVRHPVDARGRPLLAGLLHGRRPARARRRRALRRPPPPGWPTSRSASSSSTPSSPSTPWRSGRRSSAPRKGPGPSPRRPGRRSTTSRPPINDYLQWVKYDNGATLPLVNAPAQIDGPAGHAAGRPGPRRRHRRGPPRGRAHLGRPPPPEGGRCHHLTRAPRLAPAGRPVARAGPGGRHRQRAVLGRAARATAADPPLWGVPHTGCTRPRRRAPGASA